LPYQPPTLTKRGHISELTKAAVSSAILFTEDITGDGTPELFVDTNGDGKIDYVRVPQVNNGTPVNVPVTEIFTGTNFRFYDADGNIASGELATNTDVVNQKDVSVLNTEASFWGSKDGQP